MELNDLLMAKDSLAAGTRPYVNSTQFDTSYSVPTGAINYTNLTKDARPYDAVVSLSGELGTFKDIQLAINYVNGMGGGAIFIRSGTYVLSSDITLYSNISIVGEDLTTAIIDFNGTTKSIVLNGVANTHINGIRVKNSKNVTTGAINIDSSSDCSIQNCYFTNNWNSDSSDGRDIYITGSSRIWIYRCQSVSGGWFVYKGAYNYNIIEKNYQYSGKKGFISLDNAYNTSVNNNIIYQPANGSGVQIIVGANSSRTIVADNHIFNLSTNASFGGISVNSPSVTVSGNFIDGVENGTNLIEIASFINGCRIIGNDLWRGKLDHIYLNDSCSLNIIANNVLSLVATGQYGITVSQSTCIKNIIISNTAGAVFGALYLDNGTSTEIAHNTSI